MPRILLPASLESCSQAMFFLSEHVEAPYHDVLSFVELAVEELLVNVVSYAYADPERTVGRGREDGHWGMVELGCRMVRLDDMPYLCIWMRDWGAPFDPFQEVPLPDTAQALEDRSIGGLGVHLVKNVAVHYCYSGSDGENTIELYFRLSSGTSADKI
ncbi:MAG: ATP-binding protein [Desulfovibrio sp.]|nr:ATP-binding protein [Desulfovibrio sp.]